MFIKNGFQSPNLSTQLPYFLFSIGQGLTMTQARNHLARQAMYNIFPFLCVRLTDGIDTCSLLRAQAETHPYFRVEIP